MEFVGYTVGSAEGSPEGESEMEGVTEGRAEGDPDGMVVLFSFLVVFLKTRSGLLSCVAIVAKYVCSCSATTTMVDVDTSTNKTRIIRE